MTDVLTVESICKTFGGLKAVHDFSLTLQRGDLQGLIGPNGAGKTTIFNLLTGVYTPDSGTIRLCERRIGGWKPYRITACGMSRTFQNIRLFADLTVLENVLVACQTQIHHGLIATVLRTPKFHREEREQAARARELLRLMELDQFESEQAKNLPYGSQRRLEIARALATKPTVLLLDEPAAGMNPQEKNDLAALIRRLRDDFELTILLIEHDMGLVMDICESITVLDYGEVISRGDPHNVQNDPKVIEAYLGTPMALEE